MYAQEGFSILYIPSIKKVNFKSFYYINFFSRILLNLGLGVAEQSFLKFKCRIWQKYWLRPLRMWNFLPKSYLAFYRRKMRKLDLLSKKLDQISRSVCGSGVNSKFY